MYIRKDTDLITDIAYALPDRFPWTSPFHGVQHCGNGSRNGYWATVEDYGAFAALTLWTPGIGFRAEKTYHDTADDARRIGRNFVLANNR